MEMSSAFSHHIWNGHSCIRMGLERCRYALGGAVKGIPFLDGLMAGIGGSLPVNITKYWISCFKIVGAVR